MAGCATAVGKSGSKESWPHVVVANPDEQICSHPGFDLCGKLSDKQRLVALAAANCKVVRDVRHGDRLPECDPVWNCVGGDDLLGEVFGQIQRARSKYSNSPCFVRNGASGDHAHQLAA